MMIDRCAVTQRSRCISRYMAPALAGHPRIKNPWKPASYLSLSYRQRRAPEAVAASSQWDQWDRWDLNWCLFIICRSISPPCFPTSSPFLNASFSLIEKDISYLSSSSTSADPISRPAHRICASLECLANKATRAIHGQYIHYGLSLACACRASGKLSSLFSAMNFPCFLAKLQQDENDDQNVGSARDASPSLSGLLATLIPTLITFAVFTALFVVLRPRVARQYAPRTYLGSLGEFERTPRQSPGLFGWVKDMYNLPDTFVLQHNSLDAYFLLRYLKIATVICFVGCLITFPVLFPVNATGGGGQKQLNLISFSNVSNTKNRYYAHTFCAWIFISFVFFMITRESLYYINLRQAYLLSPLYASRISSRTVLFSSVPDNYLNEQRIRTMFGDKLKNLWIPTDVKDLEEKVKERDKISLKLEGAEIKLIKLANQARLKSAKKGHSSDAPPRIENDVEAEPGSAAARWITPKQRPTHRLKPVIGKKVDTINWSRSELDRLIPEVREEQHLHRAGDPKFINSVFVEFYNQTEAQAAYQMVAHHQPLHMAPRTIGFTPGEIIWSNLRIRWWERVIRNISTIAAVTATIIFWSIPVAFIGAVSNITALTHQKGLTWLSFIDKIPGSLRGVITGLLPVILMAVLFALLPIYLRLMAKLGGLPTLSAVELRTQNFYFWFQVIQVFLVTTLTSAASASFSSIFSNPSSATTLLAENIPKASNFYISYFILQGLAFSSGALLQLVGLILGKVLSKVLDTSPRKMYTRWSTLSSLGWGTIFPVIS